MIGMFDESISILEGLYDWQCVISMNYMGFYVPLSLLMKFCVSNSSHSFQVNLMKLATHDPYDV